MSQLKYPNKYTLDNVYLIGEADLEKLHNIFIEINNLVSQNNKYDESISISYSLSTNENYTIKNTESLKDLIHDHQLKQYTPKRISINYSSNNISFTLEIDKNYELIEYYVTKSADVILHNKVYSIMTRWIDSLKANIVEKIWTASISFIFGVATFFMVVIAISILKPEDIKEQYTESLNLEAHMILKNGISKDEVPKALEILLEKESGFVPDEYAGKKTDFSTLNWTKLSYMIIGYFIIILLSTFKPTFIIGIGKDTQKHNVLKFWIKAVTLGLPAYVLIPFLINKLS